MTAVQQKLPIPGSMPQASSLNASSVILLPPSTLGTIDQLNANQTDSNPFGNGDPATSAPRGATRSADPARIGGAPVGATNAVSDLEAARLELSNRSDAQRAALLASVGLDVEAVDRALGAVISEIEQIGDELIGWLDDYSAPSWAAASGVVTAMAAGSAYVWRGRARRSVEEEEAAILSAWLFNHFQMPAGSP